MLFAVSERAYGDAASEAFLRNLGGITPQHLLELTQAELPELN